MWLFLKDFKVPSKCPLKNSESLAYKKVNGRLQPPQNKSGNCSLSDLEIYVLTSEIPVYS